MEEEMERQAAADAADDEQGKEGGGGAEGGAPQGGDKDGVKANGKADKGKRPRKQTRKGKRRIDEPDPLEEYVNQLLQDIPDDPGAAGAEPQFANIMAGVVALRDALEASFESESEEDKEAYSTQEGEETGDAAESSVVDVEISQQQEEEEMALEEEMRRKEGDYARQLFSLREEEARIILEPLKAELAQTLVGMGAGKDEARLVAQVQTSFGDEWRVMVASLREELEMKGTNICNMLSRDRSLLLLRPERLVRFVQFMKELGFHEKALRYILGRRPSLISLPLYGGDGEGVSKTIAALIAFGMTRRQLRVLVTTSPGVLAMPPNKVGVVGKMLQEEGLSRADIASLLRKSPWVLLYDVKAEVGPVLECLRSIGVSDMANVVKAYPQVFGLDPEEQILRVCGVLLECDVGTGSIPSMIQICPSLLSVPVDDHLLPMLDYFQADLDLRLPEIGKMFRAYPGTMLLSVDRDIRPTEEFLRDVGIKNVGRVVTLSPAILTFDVGTQLVPKMRFLDKVGLTSYDMANFPQVFNFPLDRIIRPRLLFLVYLRIPTISKPLKHILAPTDFDFCNITLGGVNISSYDKFVGTLPPIELPNPPKASKRPPLPGKPSLIREENEKIMLRVKGDARLADYKQLKAVLQKKQQENKKRQQKGREFFDLERSQWVYEGEGTFPPKGPPVQSEEKRRGAGNRSSLDDGMQL